MPSKTKQKFLQTLHGHRQNSKIIIIEQTTWISIFIFILIKSVVYLWPQDVPQNLPEMLLMLPNLLRTYPIVTGALLSFLTWHIMYLDSAVPGINPPTPLSPVKYRESGVGGLIPGTALSRYMMCQVRKLSKAPVTIGYVLNRFGSISSISGKFCGTS
uniref:Uncharacterized protein n=1 Tax=Homalodisca liturata TaxID=320908 RepID=A0A1B6HM43_9HEMI